MGARLGLLAVCVAAIAVRAGRLGDPDVFLASDLHLRPFASRSDAWRPFRSYAVHGLWLGASATAH